ncbi:MAG: hypothetical protein V1843_04295 [bacterium]
MNKNFTRISAIILLLFFIFSIAGFSNPVYGDDISKIKNRLKVLNKRYPRAKSRAQKAKIKKEMISLKARLSGLIAADLELPPAPPPPPPPAPPPPEPTRVPEKAQPKTGGTEVGLKAGMHAGGYGAIGEVSFPLGSLKDMGIGDAVGRFGVGYVQGTIPNTSQTVKMVPVSFDVLIFPGKETMGGQEAYVGGGVNYLAARSGDRKPGNFGPQIFIGIQGDPMGMGGKTFIEVGYSYLRTGGQSTQPLFSLKGIYAMVGFKISM